MYIINHELLQTILKHCTAFDIYPSVFLDAKTMSEESYFFHENIQKLFILSNSVYRFISPIQVPPCPRLTHLYIVETEQFIYGDSLYMRSVEVLPQGNLPNLTHLRLQDYYDDVGLAALLRQCEYSTLTHLTLSEGFMEMVDNQPFLSSSKLPNLESLCVFFTTGRNVDEGVIARLFQNSWPNLRRFFAVNFQQQCDKELLAALREGKLSNLTEFGQTLIPQRRSVINLKMISHFLPKLQYLIFQHCLGPLRKIEFAEKLREIDISHSRSVTVELSALLSSPFPSLNTLALSNCGLNAANLSFLSQCGVEGTLPVLRNLDVSNNPDCVGQIGHLFDGVCMWKKIRSLYIQQACISQIDPRKKSLMEDAEVVIRKVEQGCLSALEELCFTVHSANILVRMNLKRC